MTRDPRAEKLANWRRNRRLGKPWSAAKVRQHRIAEAMHLHKPDIQAAYREVEDRAELAFGHQWQRTPEEISEVDVHLSQEYAAIIERHISGEDGHVVPEEET